MERGLAVIRDPLRRRLLLALIGAPAALCLASSAPADNVVLIVSSRSHFAPLDLLEVRKLFLGFPVLRDGQALHPLRNQSDPRLDQIFLQNIVGMSDTTYDRRVLTLLLQQGRSPPPSLRSGAQLLAAIEQDDYAVSFAWNTDVANWPQVKAIKVLWRE